MYRELALTLAHKLKRPRQIRQVIRMTPWHPEAPRVFYSFMENRERLRIRSCLGQPFTQEVLERDRRKNFWMLPEDVKFLASVLRGFVRSPLWKSST